MRRSPPPSSTDSRPSVARRIFSRKRCNGEGAGRDVSDPSVSDRASSFGIPLRVLRDVSAVISTAARMGERTGGGVTPLFRLEQAPCAGARFESMRPEIAELQFRAGNQILHRAGKQDLIWIG